MNQACVYNDTIDVGNHHGRPQYRPFLRFLTTQERSVIWLLLGIAFLPVDGTTLGLYAPFWSPISPALFAAYCLCNWRQLRIAANRYLPMFLLPVACIILSIPGWLKFGIHLNAAFMSITGDYWACSPLWVRSPWRSTSNAFRGIRHCGFSSLLTGSPSAWAWCNGYPSICISSR